MTDIQRISAEIDAANRIQKELHSVSVAQQMQAKQMQEAISRLGAASQMREAMAALDIGRQMREAMKGFEISEQMRNALTVPDVISQQMREAAAQMQSAMNVSEIIAQRMREARKAFEISDDMRRAFASLDIGNQFREAMKGFDISAQMRGAFEALNSAKQIQEALRGFEATRKMQEAIANHASVFQTLTRASSFEGINDVLKAVSSENWPTIYENAGKVSVTASGTLKVDQRFITPAELQQVVETIIDRVGSGSAERIELQLSRLIDEVKKLRDPIIEKILAWIICPLIVGIVVALVTLYGQQYLERNSSNEIRALKKAISREVVSIVGRDNLVDYRFVVATTLNVRAKSSSKAALVGTLYFGQTVQLIDRNDSWSRIRWTDGSDSNGAVLEGWVFSRYLEKFR